MQLSALLESRPFPLPFCGTLPSSPVPAIQETGVPLGSAPRWESLKGEVRLPTREAHAEQEESGERVLVQVTTPELVSSG